MTIPAAFILALIAVESGGNDHAVGDHGTAYGCLQITQPVLRDYQRITGEHITLEQCFDRLTSVSVCITYLKHYCTQERLGHEPTLADAARIWNGGPRGWCKPETQAYWAKVQKELSYPGTRAAHSNKQTPR